MLFETARNKYRVSLCLLNEEPKLHIVNKCNVLFYGKKYSRSVVVCLIVNFEKALRDYIYFLELKNTLF